MYLSMMIVYMHTLMLLRMLIALCVISMLGDTGCSRVAMGSLPCQRALYARPSRNCTKRGKRIVCVKNLMVSSAVIVLRSVCAQ